VLYDLLDPNLKSGTATKKGVYHHYYDWRSVVMCFIGLVFVSSGEPETRGLTYRGRRPGRRRYQEVLFLVQRVENKRSVSLV